ncbi:MAG TPA: acyltransferase [Anaerolineae bacterium]|nr:acyltransferase [Caldilineae bacterium]HID33948.1 acyltransferase [Anaerolineae bacterium]HIQ12015.1 acyltransferase [Caldilineales bacterium]
MKLVGPYKARRTLINLSKRSFISPHADIHCPSLHLGQMVFIDDHVTLYAHRDGGGIRIGDYSSVQRYTIFETIRGGEIVIGQHTHIQSGCNLTAALGNIRIGDHVQLAPRCALYPYQHGITDLDRPIAKQPLTTRGDIVIEDDAWLGVGVMVMDGVTIGRGAVIGAGAVVTKDIPPLAIAVGSPARVIGYRDGGSPD